MGVGGGTARAFSERETNLHGVNIPMIMPIERVETRILSIRGHRVKGGGGRNG